MRSSSGGDGSVGGARARLAKVAAGARRLRAIGLAAVTAAAVLLLGAGAAAQGGASSDREASAAEASSGSPKAGAAFGQAPAAAGQAGPPASAGSASKVEAASPSSATVVAIRGQVAWRRAGTEVWQKVEPGLALGPGDEILTWDGAHAVLQTAEGHRVELGPRTQVRVVELRASAGPGQKGGGTRLRLWLGQVWSTVAELLGTESRYQVETDSAVAAVRGTEFYVESGADGSTRVIVREGEVEVQAGGQSVTVPAGFGVQVFPGQAPGQPQPMPYPTPPSERPPTEPESTRTAPPPPSGPAPAGGGRRGLPASLETLTIRDFSVVSLGLNPELHRGPVGVSLDLRIYYTQNGDRIGFFLDRESGRILDRTEIRLDHVLQLIRWIEYDTPAFGARWGRLDPVTVGEGILVSGYRMGDETGARVRADLGVAGAMVLVPTNPTTHLYAGRLFWRPVRSSPLQVGLQAALERETDLEQRENKGLDGRATPKGTVKGYGLDVVYPLSIVTLYGQAATLAGKDEPSLDRWGASAGLSGSLAILGWRAEYRVGRGFAFGYFDGLYETWAGPHGDASQLDIPAGVSVSGYRLQADLTIPLISGLAAGASYEGYRGQDDRLGLHASVRLPDSLEATVSYLRTPVWKDEVPKVESERALLVADLRYPVRPGLYVIVRRVQPMGADARPWLTVTTEFTL